jgi:hypothetical protein
MKKRKLLHIIALTRNDTYVDLYYLSKAEAIKHNPGLTNFMIVGYAVLKTDDYSRKRQDIEKYKSIFSDYW